MYLIGVAGASGSGKTTLCKILAGKIAGSAIVDGDKLMNDTLISLGSIFSRMLGEKLQLDSEGRVRVNYFSENPARIIKAVEIATGYLDGGSAVDLSGTDNSLAPAFAAARNHMSQSMDRLLSHLRAQHSAAVIDWANLPVLDIWRSCDQKIIVTANDSQRLQRMRLRHSNRDFTGQELRNLISHAALPYDRIDCDTRIQNDSMDALERAADRIGNIASIKVNGACETVAFPKPANRR